MWKYHIGGYQVLEKYLKDRKGRQMSEPKIYCQIASAISATIKIQESIEPLYIMIEENIVENDSV